MTQGHIEIFFNVRHYRGTQVSHTADMEWPNSSEYLGDGVLQQPPEWTIKNFD
jgi:hypothetical protein